MGGGEDVRSPPSRKGTLPPRVSAALGKKPFIRKTPLGKEREPRDVTSPTRTEKWRKKRKRLSTCAPPVRGRRGAK